MMYCDPNIVALRETLLPVSCRHQQQNNRKWCTVTMYSLDFSVPVRLDMSRENEDHQIETSNSASPYKSIAMTKF